MTLEWNSLSEEAKHPFRAETEVQKKRYEVEMRAYKEKKAAEAALAPPIVPVPVEGKAVGKKKEPKTGKRAAKEPIVI